MHLLRKSQVFYNKILRLATAIIYKRDMPNKRHASNFVILRCYEDPRLSPIGHPISILSIHSPQMNRVALH